MFTADRVNKWRVREGRMGSDDSIGPNGAFFIPPKKSRVGIYLIAAAGDGWEHVSVSLTAPRTPTWEEMCKVKDLFWDEEDVVIQIHPKKSEYVNMHPNVLHLWRPENCNPVHPPKHMV